MMHSGRNGWRWWGNERGQVWTWGRVEWRGWNGRDTSFVYHGIWPDPIPSPTATNRHAQVQRTETVCPSSTDFYILAVEPNVGRVRPRCWDLLREFRQCLYFCGDVDHKTGNSTSLRINPANARTLVVPFPTLCKGGERR